MTHRYKKLLKLTRDFRNGDDVSKRLEALFIMFDCDFITIDLYCFLKRKLLQNAYINGFTVFDFMINAYFSQNDIDSFNHYTINDRSGFWLW